MDESKHEIHSQVDAITAGTASMVNLTAGGSTLSVRTLLTMQSQLNVYVLSGIIKGNSGSAPVAHRVERVALRPSPDRSDPGSIPASGPLLRVVPSLSHNVLSISL